MNSNERLTEHCRSNNPISKRMICEASPLFCHDFKDDCDKCPIGEIINRLSAYEDSGMTPEEIMELRKKKNTAKVRRCRKAAILTKTRVGRNGVLINGEYYYSDNLILNHFGDRVEIHTDYQFKKASVYFRDTLIETFELL